MESLDAFLIGKKLVTVSSFQTRALKIPWKSAYDCQGLNVSEIDNNCLKALAVDPKTFCGTPKTRPVEMQWTVVYLLALYTGDAIAGGGSFSIWYSVNNSALFAIRSADLRRKALTWFDCLRDRSANLSHSIHQFCLCKLNLTCIIHSGTVVLIQL